MPITGTWAGQPTWQPLKQPALKVGAYGFANIAIECVPARRSSTNRPYKYAVVEIPGGGLNQWTADELRAFADMLRLAADDLDSCPVAAKEPSTHAR